MMMSTFKKLQKIKNEEDVKSFLIKRKWKIFKQRIAKYLQQKSELLSPKMKTSGLVLFCLSFGGISVLIIVHAIATKDPVVLITKISNPAASLKCEKGYLQTDSSITKNEYERVEQFKNYLVRLKDDSLHRGTFDSILHERPKLLDSINLFEKIYLQQK